MNRKSEISAVRKNQQPYTFVGLGGVENGHMGGGAGGEGYTRPILCHLKLSIFIRVCILVF